MIKRAYSSSTSKLLAATTRNTGGGGVCVICGSEESPRTAVLKASESTSVAEDEVVVHDWVLRILGLRKGQEVLVQTIEGDVGCPDGETKISLRFLLCKWLISWEHVPLTSLGSVDHVLQKWTSVLPPGCSLKDVESGIHHHLIGAVLIRGAYVAVHMLDVVYIFEVSGIDSTHGGLDKICISHTSKMHRFEITAGQNLVPEYALDKSKRTRSTPTAMKVVDICRIALFPVSNPRCVRSVLVIGPSASGKSYLTEHVVKKVSQSVPNCQVIRLNLKLCESDDSMFSEPTRDRFGNIEKFENYLVGFLELFQKTEFTWNPVNPLLLCLEDIDVIFANAKMLVGGEILEDDSFVTGDRQSSIKSAAIKLRGLLSFLCRPDFPFSVIIVATTRFPVSEVPSIYSGAPGFEKILDIPKPTRQQRQKIFKGILSSSGIPLGPLPESLVQSAIASNDDPKQLLKNWAYRLASLTPGTLPGDLVSIVEKSVAISVGELERTDGSSISPSVLLWKCVLNVLSRFTPSELCSLDLSQSFQDSVRPNWDSFGGYSEEKLYLKRMLSYVGDTSKIDTETSQLRAFQACPTGLLITGFSGCGKTFLARIVACEAKMNFLYIKSNELLSPYLGQTEAKVRSIFQKARSSSPCVLFFDDFDTIACRRELDDGGGQSNLNARILSTFLNEIDGISTSPSSIELEVDPDDLSSDSESTSESNYDSRHNAQQKILVVAACFDERALDDALLRPGRLYYKVRLNKPTEKDLFEILSIRMAKLPIEKTVSFQALAKKLFIHGATGADVHDLCSRATLNAIRMIIESGQSLDVEKEVCPRVISLKNFEDAIREKY